MCQSLSTVLGTWDALVNERSLFFRMSPPRKGRSEQTKATSLRGSMATFHSSPNEDNRECAGLASHEDLALPQEAFEPGSVKLVGSKWLIYGCSIKSKAPRLNQSQSLNLRLLCSPGQEVMGLWTGGAEVGQVCEHGPEHRVSLLSCRPQISTGRAVAGAQQAGPGWGPQS